MAFIACSNTVRLAMGALWTEIQAAGWCGRGRL
jgi:hypothetical protein